MSAAFGGEVELVALCRASKPLVDLPPIAQVGPNLPSLFSVLRLSSHQGDEGVRVGHFTCELPDDGLLLLLTVAFLLRAAAPGYKPECQGKHEEPYQPR